MKRQILTIAVLLTCKIAFSQVTIFRHANIIDGTGSAVRSNYNILVKDGKIDQLTSADIPTPADATIIDLKGKFVMPQIICTHAHVGIVRDTTGAAANYTPENVKNQLLQYQKYGVSTIVSMGTEQPSILPLLDSSRAGHISGADLYTAIYGFGVKDAAPPAGLGMTNVFRPVTADEAIQEVDSLAALHPDLVKIWVDDFWGAYPKMKPEIYAAIIKEAHKKGLRVAAHVYHLEDAHRLVDLGLDIIAHSIRDAVIDDALIEKMKKKNVAYIPTLSLDELAYILPEAPEWLNDPFFRASVGPHVYDMVTSPTFKNKIEKDPKTPQEKAALQIALKNLLKLHRAGILIALGTDSGALPIRPQGFSEHMEMELFVQAGLTPSEAITAATLNGAKLLHIDKQTGTLEIGKKAAFIVLDANPLLNIKNTRTINSVWKDGKKVSDGPLAGTPYAEANNNKVAVMAEIKILPGYEAIVKEEAEKVWNATKKEEGCESFIFNIKRDDPTTIIFYEVFRDQNAFNLHRNAASTKLFLSALNGKVVENGPMITQLVQLHK